MNCCAEPQYVKHMKNYSGWGGGGCWLFFPLPPSLCSPKPPGALADIWAPHTELQPLTHLKKTQFEPSLLNDFAKGSFFSLNYKNNASLFVEKFKGTEKNSEENKITHPSTEEQQSLKYQKNFFCYCSIHQSPDWKQKMFSQVLYP